MKLKDNQIKKLSAFILEEIKQRNNMKISGSETEILKTIDETIRENMRTEQKIEIEAKRLMEAYSRQVERGEIDSGKLYHMIKAKLAKEKGFVL